MSQEENMGEVSLAQVKVGETVAIVGLQGSLKSKRRLMAMGLVGKTKITLETKAPMGDPKIYSILGYRLAIRNEDANQIRVSRLACSD